MYKNLKFEIYGETYSSKSRVLNIFHINFENFEKLVPNYVKSSPF